MERTSIDSDQKIPLKRLFAPHLIRHAEFQESVKGSITVGKLADLVFLSRDIFKIDPKEIENVKVVMTIVDGRPVYEEAL